MNNDLVERMGKPLMRRHGSQTRAAGICCLVVLLLFCCGMAQACTVPVFRYALDRWSGKSDESGELPQLYEEVANRILSGDAAVFVQVDSGNREADDTAFQRINDRLRFFESVAELPVIDPNDPASQLGPGPELVLKFSSLRIPRDHPRVKDIAGPAFEDLPEAEAWVMPLFGRGRVLGAWPASLMDEEGIDEICHFLTGACSCQVKNQNPGWDLVINVDWNERLFAIGQGDVPEVEPKPEDNGSPEDTVREDVVEISPTASNVSLVPFVVAGLLLVAGFFLLRRKK